MAYESGQLGKDMPQGSIKAFRQYADFMSLCSPPIPIWPITPIKVAFFLLFRLLMGDVAHGTPLRDQYLRGLARSLEHFREDTARRFLVRWPEAAQLILRDGRGAPEGRNDLTHDILRICKQAYSRKSLSAVLDVGPVEALVCNGNPNLLPDAWATRRRLSSRWVRDREAANLPERQYAGGKFVGEPPKPPPLSGRSTRWNRHLHDIRAGSEETSWVPSPRQRSATVASSPAAATRWQEDDPMQLDESPTPTPLPHPRSSVGTTAPASSNMFIRRAATPTIMRDSGHALASPFRGGRLPTPVSDSSSPVEPLASGFSCEPSYVPANPSPTHDTQIYGGRRRSFSAGGAILTPPRSEPSSSPYGYKPTIPSLNDIGIHPSSFPYAPLTPPSSASSALGRSLPWGPARTATNPVAPGGHRRQPSTELPYSCERSTTSPGYA